MITSRRFAMATLAACFVAQAAGQQAEPGRYGEAGSITVTRQRGDDGLALQVEGSAGYPDGTLLVAALHELSTGETLTWLRCRVEGRRYAFTWGPFKQPLMASVFAFKLLFVVNRQPLPAQRELRRAGYAANYKELVAEAQFPIGTRESWMADELAAIALSRELSGRVAAKVDEMEALWSRVVPEGEPIEEAARIWEENARPIIDGTYGEVSAAFERTRDYAFYRHKDWLNEASGFVEEMRTYFEQVHQMLQLMTAAARTPEQEQELRGRDRSRRKLLIALRQYLRRVDTSLEASQALVESGDVDFVGEEGT